MIDDQMAKRILIVEDEVLVAMHLEDLLIEMGHQVVCSAHRIIAALEFAREGVLDFAVLDVNVAGTQSFPVADILRERDIPFVFATGYGAEGFLDGYRDHPTLRKPYEPDELDRAIARAFSDHR